MPIKVKKKPDRGEVYSPRLRILIDPVYVQIANLSSSSTYYKYVSLVRELVSRGHFVYWMVPDAEYEPNPIEEHPNVAIIRTSYIQDQFLVDGLITDDFFNLFNRVGGKYHVDVLCTSRNSLVWSYKRNLEPARFHDQASEQITDKSYGMPVVLIEEFPQTPERQFSSRSYWLAQVLGYFEAERTIFLSAHNQAEVVAASQKYLTATRMAEMIDKFRIIPSGIETKQLDNVYKPDRWTLERGFNVLSVGRIFGPSYAIFLDWADYLYKAGMEDFSFTVSLSGALSGPMRAKLKRIGFDLANNVGRQFHLVENNPRANFLQMLQKYSCFVCPLSHLDHPTGLLECIYLGLPGVMPVSDYQETFFHDWPWVIQPNDKAALVAKLLEIREDPAGAREQVAHWRERIRENYDAVDNIHTLADEIELVARRHINNFRTSQGVINLAKELKGERYRFDDVVGYLKRAGHMGVSIGDMTMRGTFTYGRSTINHAMKVIGYVDDCTGPVERFVRRDIFDNVSKTR
jgi:glycosyltransferase involved in cell wall biosynthesis